MDNLLKQPGFYGAILGLYSLLAFFMEWPNHFILPMASIFLIWAEAGFETIFSMTDEECDKIADKVCEKINRP